MRVAFLIASLGPGGAERVTVTLANYWARAGHDVCILTVAGDIDDFYELDPVVERVSLSSAGASNGLLKAIYSNARRVIRLRRALTVYQPDVAIGMMTESGCLLALSAVGLRIATFGSERIYPGGHEPGVIWDRVRKLAYGVLTGVIAQTRDSATWITNHTLARSVAVIPNPVNHPLPRHAPVLVPESVTGADGRGRLVLGVGRLDRQKGFDLLINAFAGLAHEFPDWRLVLVGEGAERGALQHRAEEAGIADRVALPGAAGNIADWYDACGIYALSSRVEGFPNTLVEAMARGTAVVAADCLSGPSDLITPEVDGLLVPVDDEQALRSALHRLMADPVLRRELGQAATGVRDRLSLEEVARQWESFCGIEAIHGPGEVD